MMNKNLFFSTIVLFSFGLMSCTQSKPTTETTAIASPKVKEVMTKEKQDKLSPDAALKDLLEGNNRYVKGELTSYDYPTQIAATTNGQFPKAVILACIDSRVPVESIFDQGVGDVFVTRVAGNIEDEQLLGSMEYGVAVAGSKVLMVLGHQNCGAVKSAIKKVDVGSPNVTILLNEIEPAIKATKGERDATNKEYFSHVVKNNVTQTINDIRERSPIIAGLEKEGKVKIVGAYYSLTDGKVSLLQD